MRARPLLLAVCGPTASGKTGLAIALAKAFDGEVVSADSMQVYRGMDIGTAKPTLQERGGIPHHLLDILEPGERFSVARYVELAREAIGQIRRRGRLPILCGGTGLYLDSLTQNLQLPQMADNFPLREELAAQAREHGNQWLWERLRERDPQLAETLHPNNLGRVIRGIEVFQATGVPMSEWQRRSRLAPPEHDLFLVGVRWPRETLYRRIDSRVDQMLEQGLLEEARAFYDRGLSPTAAQAIGYKELFGYFSGEISLAEGIETLKRETRRYAKRQMTWLRRDQRVHWLEGEALGDRLAEEAIRLVGNWIQRPAEDRHNR